MPADLPPNAVTTYGMTETGSGVVYDGVPLDGVEVARRRRRGPAAVPDAAAGATGTAPTRGTPTGGSPPATPARGTRTTGRLRVHGRIGDVIVTGGEKVWPAAVERVLGRLARRGRGRRRRPSPTPSGAQRVVAVVVPGDPARPAGPRRRAGRGQGRAPGLRRAPRASPLPAPGRHAATRATSPRPRLGRPTAATTRGRPPTVARSVARRRGHVHANGLSPARPEQRPAVDDERLAGDPRRQVAGQEQRGVGDVRRARRGAAAASAGRSAPRPAPTGPGPCRS